MTDKLSKPETEVLYNESCPVCRREIHHYARLSQKSGLAIAYDDLGDEAQLKDWNLTAEQAARRLHVRKDGQIYGGIPAFVVLWREMPQYRWLARLVSLPGVYWLACKVYDHVLAPLLYQWHLRRQAKG